jgi:hydroxymethylbilane synthase
MTAPLRLGTRGSSLARTQSQHMADAITLATGRVVELVIIKTLGDVATGPLAGMPQPGVFVSALRTALLAAEVDFVVHSMKDLPSEPVDGVELAIVPTRADPHDALLSANHGGLDDLPDGARLGTSSPRRAARLRAARPDLRIEDLRGNVDSRIAKVRDGHLDATILAVAGLSRLGWASEVDEIIPMSVMLPAPAQGALAVECRADDTALLRELAALDDSSARLCTTAERAVLSAIEATCASAVGAHAVLVDGTLSLIADVSGMRPGEYVNVRGTTTLGVDDVALAHALGLRLGAQLLAEGAAPFISPGRAGA